MPYNNYFPTGYQPYQQAQLQQYAQALAQQPVQQSNSGIIWVQGEAGAKAYPVAPANSVLLMDSESECFFIKTTDASGMPLPLRTFSYKEVVQSTEIASNKDFNTDKYITKAELERRLDELKMSLMDKPASKPRRERLVIDDE